MSAPPPFLSVIVPAHQAESVLPMALQALSRSDLDRELWELIVVDDASTDGTAEVARSFADCVVRLPAPAGGPARARNEGVQRSLGQIVVFVDSDVVIHEDALRRLLNVLEENESVAAVFGAYDDRPAAPGLVSKYRNLLHRYHHLRGAGRAETFWAGLGAVRKKVFDEVGGFDESRYSRPQIEDIELGRRLRRAGHDILLDPEIQGTHLKRWTLGAMLKTDLLQRGVPWMRLLLQEGAGGNTLNVKSREKVCVGMVAAAGLAAALALLSWSWWPLAALPALLAVVLLLNLELYSLMRRAGGLSLSLASFPLHLTYYFVSGLSVVIAYSTHGVDRLLERPNPGFHSRNQGIHVEPKP